MDMQAYTPKGLLKDFVDGIVFITGRGGGTGVAFPRMHQVIIINMGDNFLVSPVYDKVPRINECRDTIWVNGKQDIPFMLENKGVTGMYAILIKLGMFPFFGHLPAYTTNDLAVGAEHWTSKDIFDLRHQLHEAASITEGFMLIEKYFTRLLIKGDLAGSEKVRWLDKAMRTTTVDEICRILGATRKKLRSEARFYFGGPVKNIQGIIRFNKTLADIAKNAQQTLSSVHQYYDQSHFINDFKARAGITPSQYRRLCQSYPQIQYTPNFLSMERETFLQFISSRRGYLA